MRDYSNTGEVQGTGSYRFLRINAKKDEGGFMTLQYGQEKKKVETFAGYIEGFKYYEDPGNDEFNIKPHKGITIFLSAMCPFTNETAVFKFDQSVHNAIIGPNIMNALLGEEDNLSKDTMLTIGVWQKNGYTRCKVEVDGTRANTKFSFNEAEGRLNDVPQPEMGVDPNTDKPLKIWKKVYQFWSDHAKAFAGRMAAKFSGNDEHDEPDFADEDEDDAPSTPQAEPPTAPQAEKPEPKEGAETMSQVELTGKLAQVEKLKTEAHLRTAYENLSKYSLSEGQLRMADGKFTMAAGKLNLGLIFSEGKISSSPLLKNDDDLPF